MMKNFLVLIVFVSTMLFGLIVSDLFGLPLKLDNYAHQNCVRWADETFERPLFTLNEAKPLMRKKVTSKDGKTGRIIRWEMVGYDKFFVAVYFGNGAADENSSLTFYDKNRFSEELKIVD